MGPCAHLRTECATVATVLFDVHHRRVLLKSRSQPDLFSSNELVVTVKRLSKLFQHRTVSLLAPNHCVVDGTSDVPRHEIQQKLREATSKGSTATQQVLTAAVRSGHLGLLRWAVDDGFAIGLDWACVAAAHGRTDILRWLQDEHADFIDYDACFAEAAFSSSITSMAWLSENGVMVEPLQYVFTAAIRSGSVVALEWLTHTFAELVNLDTVYREAASGSYVDTLQWLHEMRPASPAQVDMVAAAALEAGSVPVLRWATAHGATAYPDPAVIRLQVANGNVPIIQWVHETGRELEPQLCEIAASAGDERTVGELLRLGCEGGERAMAAAAGKGHVRLLQQLLDAGYPLSPAVMSAAVTQGVGMIEWLIARGCRFPPEICIQAARVGSIEVLERAASVQEPSLVWDARVCTAAAKGGHLPALKWLRARSCPWDATTCAAAAAGAHLQVLKWLRGQVPACPWDHRASAAAASGKHLLVLAWLEGNGCPRACV